MAAGKPYLLNPLPNIRPQPRRLHEPGRDSVAVEQSKSYRDLIERDSDGRRSLLFLLFLFRRESSLLLLELSSSFGAPLDLVVLDKGQDAPLLGLFLGDALRLRLDVFRPFGGDALASSVFLSLGLGTGIIGSILIAEL